MSSTLTAVTPLTDPVRARRFAAHPVKGWSSQGTRGEGSRFTVPRPHSALFCGDEGGGETWAILASLLNTAKLNGLDPETWLTDVLERIVSGATKNDQLQELLAWNWKAAREAETNKAAA